MPVERVPFVVERALEFLAPYKHAILIGAKAPVAFFAYPDKPSKLTPESCELHRLSTLDEDSVHALEWLADELGATGAQAVVQPANRPDAPSGALTSRCREPRCSPRCSLHPRLRPAPPRSSLAARCSGQW